MPSSNGCVENQSATSSLDGRWYRQRPPSRTASSGGAGGAHCAVAIAASWGVVRCHTPCSQRGRTEPLADRDEAAAGELPRVGVGARLAHRRQICVAVERGRAVVGGPLSAPAHPAREKLRVGERPVQRPPPGG